MTRLLRLAGFLLIVAGAVVVLTWLVKPLRQLWPWLLQLPLPIRLGFGLAAIGLLIILSSLIWERWEERESDRNLLDD